MTNQTAPSPNSHKHMVARVSGELQKLRESDPWLARFLTTYITSLRAESARNRVRVKELEAMLRGGDRLD